MTKTYKTYQEFLARENKADNGVNEDFAKSNLDFEKENAKNIGCWNCSGCSDCEKINDAKPAIFGETSPKEENLLLNIPVVPNIHQRVLELVKVENAFNMGNWYEKSDNACGMTYCRGWATVLAAGDAGKRLVNLTTWEFAAMMIYKASSPIRVSPVRFYETNEQAMADIVRCAEEEAKLVSTAGTS